MATKTIERQHVDFLRKCLPSRVVRMCRKDSTFGSVVVALLEYIEEMLTVMAKMKRQIDIEVEAVVKRYEASLAEISAKHANIYSRQQSEIGRRKQQMDKLEDFRDQVTDRLDLKRGASFQSVNDTISRLEERVNRLKNEHDATVVALKRQLEEQKKFFILRENLPLYIYSRPMQFTQGTAMLQDGRAFGLCEARTGRSLEIDWSEGAFVWADNHEKAALTPAQLSDSWFVIAIDHRKVPSVYHRLNG